jgi:hypothetical protein
METYMILDKEDVVPVADVLNFYLQHKREHDAWAEVESVLNKDTSDARNAQDASNSYQEKSPKSL